jgi:hypothetical protein
MTGLGQQPISAAVTERPVMQNVLTALLELGRPGGGPPHKPSGTGLPPCTGPRCGPVQGPGALAEVGVTRLLGQIPVGQFPPGGS